MPLIASFISLARLAQHLGQCSKLTGLFPPAAKGLVQVETGGAIPEFDIREPLCNDVQQRCVEANCRPDDCDDDPALGGII